MAGFEDGDPYRDEVRAVIRSARSDQLMRAAAYVAVPTALLLLVAGLTTGAFTSSPSDERARPAGEGVAPVLAGADVSAMAGVARREPGSAPTKTLPDLVPLDSVLTPSAPAVAGPGGDTVDQILASRGLGRAAGGDRANTTGDDTRTAGVKAMQPVSGQAAGSGSPFVEVTFAYRSSALDREAKSQLDSYVDGLRNRAIVVTGYTDAKGARSINEALSRERAEAVAAYLRARSEKPLDIRVEWKGERALKVPTPDGILDQRNRRVTVTLDRGSQAGR